MPRAATSSKSRSRKSSSAAPAAPSAAALRAVIESVRPEIDGGRFPAKRTAGEIVRVEADVFADGHDKVAADLLYRYAGLAADPIAGAQAPGGRSTSLSPPRAESRGEWKRLPMAPLGNDRWQGSIPLAGVGRYAFTIEAWRDLFGSWREEVEKKHGAGLALTGMRPIVHTFASFLVERPFEQVKLGFGHQGVGGVLVSSGGSFDIAAGGRTHQAPGDVALLDTLPGINIHTPGTAAEVDAAIRTAVADDGLHYVRVVGQTNREPRRTRPGTF